MPEPDVSSRVVIPEYLMLSRLAQSEQMREFFIQMWLQNPVLARQGGIKVQNLLSQIADVNVEEMGSNPDSKNQPSGNTGQFIEEGNGV